MKKHIFFILIWALGGIYASAQDWNESMYAYYTPEKFESMGYVHERIDFQHINYSLLQAALFYATNAQRQAKGLPLLMYKNCLENAAKGHSDDMVSYAFFSHTSPVKGKEEMHDRLKQANCGNSYTGAENIAMQFGIEYQGGIPVFPPSNKRPYFSYSASGKPKIENHTYWGFAQTIVKQWMDSQGHKENILDKEFRFLGCGASFALDANFYDIPVFYCTQNFSTE